jgi:3-oxoacyl-[acyl-carrier-protein] synthase II
MSKKRVVITGMGTVNPVGKNVTEYWESLTSGKSGVQKITCFDPTDFSTRIAAEIKDFDASSCFEKKEIRRTAKFIQYAVVAATEALNDSGLKISDDAENVGVEIGSGMGGLEILEENMKSLLNRGPGKVSPFAVPMMITDMAAGQVSMKFGAKGPNSCSVTACASSTHSIGNAFRIIQNGDAVAMIAGGTEAAITPLGVASFCAARSLSTRNDDPSKASRPFDANRDGFVMGEGAGMVILEEYDHAVKRGANIYAEVVGFGSTGDAYHITAPAPEGEGARRAIKRALADGNIDPNAVDYINAHGTSTGLNDKLETAAIKYVFGEHARDLSISSTKSMTGHLLGATGAIELIATVLAITNSLVPPTINYETPDPDCDLEYTPNKPKQREIRVALSNSFGFGGHNAVLAIKKHTA